MVDLNNEVMKAVRLQLQEEIPNLQVVELLADCAKPIDLPEGRDLISSNFPIYSNKGQNQSIALGTYVHKFEAVIIPRSILESLGKDGVFLTTFDTNKDTSTNLDTQVKNGIGDLIIHGLAAMNRLYGADFDTAKFEYECHWNEEENCADHMLVSQSHQKVTADGKFYTFEKGEAMRMLFGKKRSINDFGCLATEARGVIKGSFFDKQQGFLCMAWIEKDWLPFIIHKQKSYVTYILYIQVYQAIFVPECYPLSMFRLRIERAAFWDLDSLFNSNPFLFSKQDILRKEKGPTEQVRDLAWIDRPFHFESESLWNR